MFREYLNLLEKNGEIMHVKNEKNKDLEIAKIIAENEKKTIIFDNIKGHKIKVIAGVVNSRDNIARAINCKKEEIVFKMSDALDKTKTYKIVEKAPFMENIVENPDIEKIVPILKYYPKADRYYTSAGIVAVMDPETKKMNYSFHRMMYHGKNKFTIRIVPRHLNAILEKTKGEYLEVAVIYGVHPAICLGAATSYTLGFNEVEFANALVGEKITCIKVNGIDIPTHAEIVMVGKIYKNKLEDEGPFVDLTGTYDIVRKQPVLEISKLYYRNDAIYPVILPGGVEHKLLMGVPQEPRMFKIISNATPNVKNVVLSEGGCCWFHAVVSIKKRVEGEAKNAGLAALSAHPSLKRVVVVDEDVDATNPEEVEWAIATRVQPHDDITIITNAHGSSLDPSQNYDNKTTSKWIIDATIPLSANREKFMKAQM